MHNAPQNTNDRGVYWSAIFITGMLLALVAFVLVSSSSPANGSTGTVTESGSSDIQIIYTAPSLPDTSGMSLDIADDGVVSMVSDSEEGRSRVDRFFDAIRTIETGGHPNPNEAIGDGGDSLGAYQIQRPYFNDAMEHFHRLRSNPSDQSTWQYRYEDVKKPHVARTIMECYFYRYANSDIRTLIDSNATEAEFLAAAVRLGRIHNGGPRGHTRESTARYGERLRQLLTQ